MNPVRVEVDLYSGRPNPMWTLEPRDAERFGQFLEQLRPAHSDSRSSGENAQGLGYRGIKVEVQANGAVKHLRIAKGIVTEEQHKELAPRIWSDSGRTLEKWLLKTGESHLGDDLVRYLIGQERKPDGSD